MSGEFRFNDKGEQLEILDYEISGEIKLQRVSYNGQTEKEIYIGRVYLGQKELSLRNANIPNGRYKVLCNGHLMEELFYGSMPRVSVKCTRYTGKKMIPVYRYQLDFQSIAVEPNVDFWAYCGEALVRIPHKKGEKKTKFDFLIDSSLDLRFELKEELNEFIQL